MKLIMSITINLATEEIFWKGLYFPFRKVKKLIPEYEIKSYQVGKPKLLPNAVLQYRYAWDAIFLDYRRSGRLEEILSKILEDESHE